MNVPKPETPGSPAPGLRSPLGSPWVNLLLCAVCVYAGILFALMCIPAAVKVNYFMGAAFSFIAAFRLFQNYLKLRVRKGPRG